MNANLIKLSALATLSSTLFFGCTSTPIRSITPEQVPQNPSGIYTITMSTDVTVDQSVNGTYKPMIVVDGTSRRMKASKLGDHFWEYDYNMPKGQEIAHYYFELEWEEHHHGANGKRNVKSDIYSLQIVDRVIFSLEHERGLVGSNIGIIGRGFNAEDKVKVGNTIAPTHYVSSTSLHFTVPVVDSEKSYRVQLINNKNSFDVGSFFVDAFKLRVSPSALSLMKDENKSLTFNLDKPAPEGGLVIDVTTDIPQSVIMPEVMISAGKTSKTINVQGGQPGNGSLFVKAIGYSEEVIAVTVE